MSVDRSQDDCMDGNNIWDDSILIKNYDASMKLYKEEVARRIACSTNSELKNKELCESTNSNDNKSKETEYQVGDIVRATFTDGIDYEATIISIDKTYGKCVVKYIGYGNEECVNLDELIASWGVEECERQKNACPSYEIDSAEDGPSEYNVELPIYKSKNSIKRNKNKVLINPQSVFTPPPPPMPPMFDNNSTDDSLSAMLMSWYMSGYYTGLYQGQRMGEKCPKQKK